MSIMHSLLETITLFLSLPSPPAFGCSFFPIGACFLPTKFVTSMLRIAIVSTHISFEAEGAFFRPWRDTVPSFEYNQHADLFNMVRLLRRLPVSPSGR
jgi:hypothetical protein